MFYICLVKNFVLICHWSGRIGTLRNSCILILKILFYFFISKEKSKLKFTFKALCNVLFFNFSCSGSPSPLGPNHSILFSLDFFYLCLLFGTMKYLSIFKILPVIIVFIFENMTLISLCGTFQGLSCSQ